MSWTQCVIYFALASMKWKSFWKGSPCPGEGKEQNTCWDTRNVLHPGRFHSFWTTPSCPLLSYPSIPKFQVMLQTPERKSILFFCKSDSWERRLSRAHGILWMHQSHERNKLFLLGWNGFMPAVCSLSPLVVTLSRGVLGDSRKENSPSKPKTQREVRDHVCHALSFIEES